MWNYPPSRLLVPIDFGDASTRAIQVAGALAGRFASTLQLLHVETFEAAPYFTHEQIARIEGEMMVARRTAEHQAADLARHLVNVPFAVRLASGDPAASILEAARSADLVVMGTHGRRGARRWWLGSEAERVASETPVPLLVVRASAVDQPAGDLFKRPLMVTVSGAFDGEANKYASGLAQASSGTLAETAARCEADMAREREATLVVIGKRSHAGTWLDAPEERLLRKCAVAMLFVPPLA